jgi:hypothetical protein
MGGSVVLQFFESLTAGRVVTAVSLFFLGAFIVDFTWKPRYPASLPRIGYGDGVLGTMRNWLGYVLYFNDWVAEGYEKVRLCATCHSSSIDWPYGIGLTCDRFAWAVFQTRQDIRCALSRESAE